MFDCLYFYDAISTDIQCLDPIVHYRFQNANILILTFFIYSLNTFIKKNIPYYKNCSYSKEGRINASFLLNVCFPNKFVL